MAEVSDCRRSAAAWSCAASVTLTVTVCAVAGQTCIADAGSAERITNAGNRCLEPVPDDVGAFEAKDDMRATLQIETEGDAVLPEPAWQGRELRLGSGDWAQRR